MSAAPPDIFISYAREDLGWVRPLAMALERRRWRVFWDRRIPAGKTWRSHLGVKLDIARCVIVVWSEHAAASRFVLQEADTGLERDVLVPVLRAPIRPPLGFREIHAADLSGWHPDQPSAEFDALLADLSTLLSAAEPAATQTDAPAIYRVPAHRPGDVFRDVDEPWCPEMVVIPTGSFMMGSPETEEGRTDNEGPQRWVTLAQPFALGRHTVTRGQFAAFVVATGHDLSGGTVVWTGRKFERKADRDWRSPGFEQTDAHAVVCVSWNDAQAYARWLSAQTAASYRLPTEAEWEYAARAGTTTPFWTGATISTSQANYYGDYAYESGVKGLDRKGTVVVDDPSFPDNPFGLFHVHGNVWEWVQDCYAGSCDGAPTEGHLAVDRKDCPERVLRGGSWGGHLGDLRSAKRLGRGPDNRFSNTGFRLARMLTS